MTVKEVSLNTGRALTPADYESLGRTLVELLQIPYIRRELAPPLVPHTDTDHALRVAIHRQPLLSVLSS